MGGGGDNKVLGCVSCIVCLITLGLLAGHSAVIISMIILADGDAAYEVSPTCDSRKLGSRFCGENGVSEGITVPCLAQHTS